MGKRSEKYNKVSSMLREAYEEYEALLASPIVRSFIEKSEQIKLLESEFKSQAANEASKDPEFRGGEFGDIFYFDITPRRKASIEKLVNLYGDPELSGKTIEDRAIALAKSKKFKGIITITPSVTIGALEQAVKSEILEEKALQAIVLDSFSVSIRRGEREREKNRAI